VHVNNETNVRFYLHGFLPGVASYAASLQAILVFFCGDKLKTYIVSLICCNIF